MIRLVLAPDGMIVPDLAEKLPGRGMWIDADRQAVEAAIAARTVFRGLSRSLKTRIGPDRLPEDMVHRVETLLFARVRSRLGLMNKAGAAVFGFEKVRECLRRGNVALLLCAADAAPDSRRKLMSGIATGVLVYDLLDRLQLGLAFGRDNVVHAAVIDGGGVESLRREIARLAAWLGRSPCGNADMSARAGGPQQFEGPTGGSEE